MRALVFEEIEQVAVASVPEPRIEAAGDLETLQGEGLAEHLASGLRHGVATGAAGVKKRSVDVEQDEHGAIVGPL